MKKVIFLTLSVMLLGAACNKTENVQQQPQPTPYSDGIIHIAGRSVSAEIVETPIQQSVGLSGRASIEENQGMLFVFQVPDLLQFWMKDMNFPIDIIWIKGDEVIDISTEVQPQPGVPLDQLKTYVPKKPADRVLELKAGWAARNNLKIGDKIEVIKIIDQIQ